MSPDPSTTKLARGRLLREQGRNEDALAYFREAVGSDPENDAAFAELALTELEVDGQRRSSLDSIEKAIALSPNHGGYHAIRSLVLSRLNRDRKALEAAERAIALDPDDPFHFAAKAEALLGLRRWADAEDAARQALALDPDHFLAGNLLAMALRFQGRTGENAEAVEKLLASDPDDPLVHYNAGWSALQRGDRTGAEAHFRESLRLDPGCDYARDGLLECFKARSLFYRAYLKYCFFMQRFSGAGGWAVVITLYLAYRFGSRALGKVHPLLGVGVAALYLGFVFWVWLAPGIGGLLVLLDGSARQALRRAEKVEALAVGGGLLAGIVLSVAAVAFGSFPTLLIPGIMLIAAAIPASLTFTNPSKSGRRLFGAVTAYIWLAGLIAFAVESVRGTSTVSGVSDLSSTLIALALIAAIACTWLGNIRSLRVGGGGG